MEYAVIMAGGRGERFWPLSRQSRPKQLLPIISERTMLEETVERILPMVPAERVLVVTDRALAPMILEKIPRLTAANILAEPQGRNTCLAIGLAAVELARRDPDAVMLVLPSDHLVWPDDKLLEILREAVRIARQGDHLVTIGINPTRPEIGYGYIEIGSQFAAERGVLSFEVASFKEKPDRVTAQQYYHDRRHLWNSGMFIWSAPSILEAIGRCRPAVRTALNEYAAAASGSGRRDALEHLYTTGESVSIDVAVLESADNVVVIKGDLKWDDVGSWLALQRIRRTTNQGNVEIGSVLCQDTVETTVVNDGDGIVVCFGVADLVVVKTANIVMITHKAQASEIKKLLGQMEADEQLRQYL